MTPRETAIEKIAFAIAMANGSTKELNIEVWKQSIRVSAIAALDTLLAALPGLGIKMVPLVATHAMEGDALMLEREGCDHPDPKDTWEVMLAAAPDLFAEANDVEA